jgi:hypothetical protein
MKDSLLLALLPFLCSIPAFCQNGFHELRQSSPELCGRPGGTVPLPRDFSATFDQDGIAKLFVTNGVGGIPLKYSLYSIEEVCPASGRRLVVFGDVGNGTSLYVIDGANPSLLDTVLAFYPRMSPDQTWVVYVKFYPRHTELPPSTEYLLYDLSRTPRQNRAPGVRLDENVDVGTSIYPPGWKNEPGDNVGAPQGQRHGMAPPFFWSPDSRDIVFEDVDGSGQRSIVLIRIGADRARTAASVLPFADSIECGPGASEGKIARPTGLRHVEFGPQQATDRVVLVDYEAGSCNPRTVQFRANDFKAARIEPRVVEKPTRKAKVDGQPPE